MPTLVPPSSAYRESFMAALAEYPPTETDMRYEREDAAIDFDDYIRRASAWSTGVDLPRGWVPVSTFWLVHAGGYLGSVAVRHSLTEYMHRFGGHIGYIVRPSERRRGYGTLICALALDEARQLGLDRVLLTCAETNIGSAKIIERNGGILQDTIMVGTRPTRRYWIELSQPVPRR